MHWKKETIHSIEGLYNDKGLDAWGDAINSGEIDELSEECHYLLNRLAGILISELELDRSGYTTDKIKKILELAAMGGKIV